jgi:hypothetical protein
VSSTDDIKDHVLNISDPIFPGIINNSECCILGKFTGHSHALKIQELGKHQVKMESPEIQIANINF